MKTVFSITMLLTSGLLFAQNTVEQASIVSNSPFTEHLKQFSWLYITAFVLLIVVFAAVYFLGWDKKLFKTRTKDDSPQLFI